MALYGDPTWVPELFKQWGIPLQVIDGAMMRGHGDFKELMGVIGHHTAGGGSNDWRIVLNGRPDLAGPLAQLVLEKDGTYKLICVGVAWHAGSGSWKRWPRNNANWHTIGIEAVSRGTAPWDWTDIQLKNYKLGVAALLWKMGISAEEGFAGHKEYSAEGKIDPAGIDLHAFRREVQALIDNPPFMPKAQPKEELAVDKLNDVWVQSGSGKPFPVRPVFQKIFYNIKDGKFWSLAGLADVWNEVVWDGYVNPVDLLDGKADPDIEPDSPNKARRGSLMSYALATYREATLARRYAEENNRLLRAVLSASNLDADAILKGK